MEIKEGIVILNQIWSWILILIIVVISMLISFWYTKYLYGIKTGMKCIKVCLICHTRLENKHSNQCPKCSSKSIVEIWRYND